MTLDVILFRYHFSHTVWLAIHIDTKLFLRAKKLFLVSVFDNATMLFGVTVLRIN